MSAKVVQHPNVRPEAIWPGCADVNPTGATIAREMLMELQSIADDAGPSPGDYSCLEDWPREGRPFRNVVAEYAARAHAAGPEALDGFYAVLSDYVGTSCLGCVRDIEFYDRFAGNEQEAPA